MNKRPIIPVILWSIIGLTGCATQKPVSYKADVKPILDTKCMRCHQPQTGHGYLQGRLNMETYESLLKGSIYGPVILPGDSQRSILNKLVEGRLSLPMSASHPLTSREVEILRTWVDQGALDN